MRLTFLGTCAGTEPMPRHKHASFTIEIGDNVYWFDAGEGCSRTAHLMGINLCAIRGIFISHPHIDHIGGLANLFHSMAKLNHPDRRLNRPPLQGNLPVFFPDADVWGAILTILQTTTEKFPMHLDLLHDGDGVVFNNEGLRVTALHNQHMGEPAIGERWRSYSFRIEAEGQTIVASGDVKNISELESLLPDCDMLLMETGHHKVEEICEFLRDNSLAPKKLVFFHNGRAILADPESELQKAQQILGDIVTISEDGMQITT
jgi:ribonuclease BN (tRNA processing enzyme)